MDNPISEFETILRDAGLVPGEIIADGALHRCGTSGKERGLDGAYVLHLDAPPSGWWRNFRTSGGGTWTFRGEKGLTSAERRKLKERVERDRTLRREEEAQRHAEAREKTRSILEACPVCPANHPYLTQKGIGSVDGLRVSRDGRLVVPVLD